MTPGSSSPSGAPKIRVRGLTKQFGSNAVLRGVDLDVAAGQSLVVIGGSGTGKSVLLRCILGLIRPDAGSIEIDGVDITRLTEKKRARITQQIGMLFQSAALLDSLRVWENVAFRLLYAEHRPTAEAKERATTYLQAVGLTPDVGALYPSELSGGMQKRVGLARAIAAEPAILFFDEPTTGLDPIMADVINRLIVDRIQALSASAISITHDMGSARLIADDIAMLHEGRIIWRGGADDLDQTGDAMVDQFVQGRADGPIQMAVRAPTGA